MDRHNDQPVGSGAVGSLTLRLSDDLHAAARRAAGSTALAVWIREAIAKEIGRAEVSAQLTAQIAELEERLARIERRLQIDR